MLQRAVEEFGIDLNQSFVVGDRYGDIEFACNGGAHSIFVLSGYGLGEYEYQRHNWRIQPEWVAKDLYEAAQIILGIVPQPATMS